MDVEKIISVAEKIKQGFEQRRASIDACRRYGYQMTETNDPSWDSTKTGNFSPIISTFPAMCARKLAQYLYANTVGLGETFFSLDAEPRRTGETIDTHTKSQIRDLTRAVMSKFMQSNAAATVADAFRHYVVVGSALTFCDYNDREKEFYFKNFEVGRGTYWDEDERTGKIDTVVRFYRLTPKDAVSKWGKDRVPADIYQKSLTPESINEENDYIWIVYPRESMGEMIERDEFGAYLPGEKSVKTRKKWASVHVCLSDRSVIDVSGYDYFPFATLRAERRGTSVYGYSPVETSIADIKRLFQMLDKLQRGINKQVDAPLLVSPLLSNINTDPDAVTYYEGLSDAQAPFVPLPTPNNLQYNEREIERVCKSIWDNFMLDEFEAVNAESARYMKAESVKTLNTQSAKLIAPTVYQIHEEYLSAMIKRMFMSMLRHKDVELPTGVDAGEIVVRYHSNLSALVKQTDFSKMTEIIGFIIQMANARANMGDYFDAYLDSKAILTHAIEFMNVPSDIINSPKVVEERLAAIKKAQQEMQAAQIQNLTAKPIDLQANAAPGAPLPRL